jgi:two-component system sensor histidine kinase KdpD
MDLLETLARLIAAPLERGRLAEAAETARVEAHGERLRSTLLSSVSHDFRTPLAAITGAASGLLGPERLEPPARVELASTIYEEAVRLDRLVANLLDMTRLESGAVRPAREWHSLEEIVGAAARRMERTLEGRRLEISLVPDLPLVFVDAGLFEQVFVNLLDNAAKYTPAGSTIAVSAERGDGEVVVEVSDDGPGLPPGDERRVFEKFFRRSSGRGGFGLGLAICRSVVEAHGGTIRAENRRPAGVTFRFTIPLGGSPPALPEDARDERPS